MNILLAEVNILIISHLNLPINDSSPICTLEVSRVDSYRCTVVCYSNDNYDLHLVTLLEHPKQQWEAILNQRLHRLGVLGCFELVLFDHTAQHQLEVVCCSCVLYLRNPSSPV